MAGKRVRAVGLRERDQRRRAVRHRRRQLVLRGAAANERTALRSSVGAESLSRPRAPRHRGLLRVELRQRARDLARDEGRRPEGARVEARASVGRRGSRVEECRVRSSSNTLRRRSGRHARATAHRRRLAARGWPMMPPDDRSAEARTARRFCGRCAPSCCARDACRRRSSARSTSSCRVSALPSRPSALDFDRLFARHAPTILEIGFGMGETTPRSRRRMPQR